VTDKGAEAAVAAATGDLTADCVHCGFCLSSCPTYVLGRNEAQSPRGRIPMARNGEIPLAEAAAHFDGCLGCLACVTACPSGVEYDKIIDGVRVDLEREVLRHWRDRLFRWFIFALFPYPARLRVAVLGGWDYQRVGLRALLTRLGLRQALPARLRAVEALMPPADLCSALSRIPAKTPAEGDARGHVGLVTGCVQRVFFHEVNAAAVRVLAAEGCEVLAPRTQACCGALSLHAGREDEAVARARAMIDTFDYVDVDTIVVNVANCGSILKQYGDLLRDDPAYAQRAAAFAAKVKDVTELLAELEPRAPRGPVDATVAYHDACHLAHAQGVRFAPRAVLQQIPGIALVDVPEADLCCGSAGIYKLVEPEAAEELGKRKAENLLARAPDIVATANPGCLLQIGRHLPGEIPILHPVQLVDASIRRVNRSEIG
jgi:glycolate oxidase iron-sulfur subunit